MQSEGYLKKMEIVVKRMRFLAGERARRTPTQADVQDAIAYMMPVAVPQTALAAPRRPQSARSCSRSAKRLRRRCKLGRKLNFPAAMRR